MKTVQKLSWVILVIFLLALANPQAVSAESPLSATNTHHKWHENGETNQIRTPSPLILRWWFSAREPTQLQDSNEEFKRSMRDWVDINPRMLARVANIG